MARDRWQIRVPWAPERDRTGFAAVAPETFNGPPRVAALGLTSQRQPPGALSGPASCRGVEIEGAPGAVTCPHRVGAGGVQPLHPPPAAQEGLFPISEVAFPSGHGEFFLLDSFFNQRRASGKMGFCSGIVSSLPPSLPF